MAKKTKHRLFLSSAEKKSDVKTPKLPLKKFDKRVLAMVGLFLLLFSVCEARLYVLALDTDAYAAVQRQTSWSAQLTNGRGMICDHNFQPLTNLTNRYVAVISSGTRDYLELFDATLQEDRPLLYSGVGKSTPFLVRLNSTVENREDVFSYTQRYADVPLALHVIGYCNSDGVGVTGLERAFNDYLTDGEDALSVFCSTNAMAQADGTQLPWLDSVQGTGNALQLSLDRAIQRVCEDVACDTITTGAIVVMECRTGRIKASVSMPQYDPEDVQKSIEAQDTALINRAFSSYNVGSVYKPLLAALALEQGFDPMAEYECTGEIEVDGHIYHCAYQKGHGSVNMLKALEDSCNCYFIWLGQQLGGKSIVDYSSLSGLGRATQLGGGYKAGSGNLPDETVLQNSGELAGLCFGQGKLTATPLQLAAAFNVFANNGIYVSPTLVEGEFNSYTGEVTQSFYRPEELQVISEETAAAVRDMLTKVVEEGLGAGAAIPEASVAGKTGTAQTGRTRKNEDGTETEIYESWFVGFYPAQNPQYTIAVMMDSTDRMGEAVAPVFGKVCRALYYLGIQ